jgi:hydrogenase expression/formation protein HypC
MCLAVPGRVVTIINKDPLLRSALVSFGEMQREVYLAFVPEAEEGMYVLIHAGIAISVVTEEEALRTLSYLNELQEVS